MGYVAGQGTFFQSPRSQMVSFLEVPDSVSQNTSKNQKFIFRHI